MKIQRRRRPLRNAVVVVVGPGSSLDEHGWKYRHGGQLGIVWSYICMMALKQQGLAFKTEKHAQLSALLAYRQTEKLKLSGWIAGLTSVSYRVAATCMIESEYSLNRKPNNWSGQWQAAENLTTGTWAVLRYWVPTLSGEVDGVKKSHRFSRRAANEIEKRCSYFMTEKSGRN